MKVTLTQPVEHAGKTYRRVSVRVPFHDPSLLEDSCPAHIDPALWNVAVLTKIPLQAAAELAPADIIAIGREFRRQIDNAMARAAGGRFQ